jgi:hypothetical protein
MKPVQVSRSANTVPHKAFTKDDIGRIKLFIHRIKKEDGFLCADRQPRQYLTKQVATVKTCWRVYVMVMNSNGFTSSLYVRFNEYYWKHILPALKVTRLASDAFTSCVCINVAWEDPSINQEEKEDLEAEKLMYLAAVRGPEES